MLESQENDVAQLPPPIHDEDFAAVDTTDEEEILRRFNSFVRSLHSYLNGLPSLRDLQNVRRRWKARTSDKLAFGNFVAHSREFYTFHSGGRKEGHFNICLRPGYFGIGLGYEFTLNKGGDPTAVQLAYSCFMNVVGMNRNQFERFVAENHLEVEFSGAQDRTVQIVPTSEVVPWILNLDHEPRWIMIGRLLRRVQDAHVLADPDALGKVIEAVISGFRPYWERAQVMACA